MLSTFSYVRWPSECLSLKKCHFTFSTHLKIRVVYFFFLKWVVWVAFILYFIFGYYSLSDTWLANIVFHLVGCLFILLVSFAVQSFLVWSSSYLFAFAFLAFAFSSPHFYGSCFVSCKILAISNCRKLLYNSLAPLGWAKCFMWTQALPFWPSFISCSFSLPLFCLLPFSLPWATHFLCSNLQATDSSCSLWLLLRMKLGFWASGNR